MDPNASPPIRSMPCAMLLIALCAGCTKPEPAQVVATPEPGQVTTPASAVDPPTSATCDFEGEVIWVAGLARTSPYTATVLSEPSRLVIDIAH